MSKINLSIFSGTAKQARRLIVEIQRERFWGLVGLAALALILWLGPGFIEEVRELASSESTASADKESD